MANVADVHIGPDLTLKRGLVAAGLAAIIGAVGLVLAGGIGDILRAVARSGSGGSAIIVGTQGQAWNVGVPLARLPSEWLFQASFLLGVLFVTGPQLRPRDLVKGIVVVFGVQSTVQLMPALIPPFRPVDLWSVSGPVLTPLGDAVLLFGIAVAVWLTFYDGLDGIQYPFR